MELREIGQWWGTDSKKKKQIQIDIVGTPVKGGSYIIGSCKYKNEKIGLDELELIREYASVFGKGTKYYYYIFYKGGFYVFVGVGAKARTLLSFILQRSLKPKFSMAYIETIYAVVFFDNGDDAVYTDSVAVFSRYWDVIFKYRVLLAAVRHVNAQQIIFFIYLQIYIAGRRRFHLCTGMDRIFHGICQKTAQIRNLES